MPAPEKSSERPIFPAAKRDGACGVSWGTIISLHRDWITGNDINVLVKVGLRRHPDLPAVPTLQAASGRPQQALSLGPIET